MKIHIGNIILFSLILLVFYSCIDIPTGPNFKPPTFDGEIKIGAILTLTGIWGYESEKRGIDLAVQEINSVGGILGKKVTVEYKDTHGHLNMAYSAAQDLIADDNIAVVVGCSTSASALTVAPLFAEAQKVLILTSATTARISDEYSSSGYIWRSILSDSIQTMALAHKIVDFNSGSFINVDNTYGNGLIQPLKNYLIRRLKPSFRIKTSFTFKEEDEDVIDFHSLLKPIVEDNPEVIVIGAYSQHGAKIVEGLKNLNYKGEILCCESCKMEQFIYDMDDPLNAEGVMGTAPYVDPDGDFFKAYEQQYSHPPDPYATSAYDAVYIAAYTLEKAGSNNVDAFIESIESVANQPGRLIYYGSENFIEGVRIIRSGDNVNYIGASGYCDFHPLGLDLLGGIFEYWRVEDGKFVTIGTFTL